MSEPRRMLPDRTNCALLVIDVQERLTAAMPPQVAAAVIRNTSILIQTARLLNLPVVASEQYPKGLGPTAAEVAAVLPESAARAEKTIFSCCAAPGVQPLLGALGERDLILGGIETHVCVLQTALDLLAQGRRVFIAADATCSRSKQNWRLGLEMMREAGAVIGSTEIFAFGLVGGAGSPEFKEISRLVK